MCRRKLFITGKYNWISNVYPLHNSLLHADGTQCWRIRNVIDGSAVELANINNAMNYCDKLNGYPNIENCNMPETDKSGNGNYANFLFLDTNLNYDQFEYYVAGLTNSSLRYDLSTKEIIGDGHHKMMDFKCPPTELVDRNNMGSRSKNDRPATTTSPTSCRHPSPSCSWDPKSTYNPMNYEGKLKFGYFEDY